MSLDLKKFDMKKIRSDSVVVLIGKRDTGKSFLCKDLLYHNMSIPVGVVISGTESANSFYKSMGAYRETFNNKSDVLVVEPESPFFKHMR